jgi:hypothetical protein
MKLVLVIWHDAHSGSGTWEYLNDLEDDGPYVVRSVGYLIDAKKHGKNKHTSIGQSLSEVDCLDSILHIPNAMVQKIITLIEEPELKTIQKIFKQKISSVKEN